MARITRHGDEEWEVTPQPVTIPATPPEHHPEQEPEHVPADPQHVPAEPKEPEKVGGLR